MKCNYKCPYAKPNGKNVDGTQSIVCEARNWFVTEKDDCVEKYTEEDIQVITKIFGKPRRLRYKLFRDLMNKDDWSIVDMYTEESFPRDDAETIVNLLNHQDELLFHYRRREVKKK